MNAINQARRMLLMVENSKIAENRLMESTVAINI